MEHLPLKRILVPFDNSPAAKAVWDTAATRAKSSGAEVVLLLLNELPETSKQAKEEDQQNDALFAKAEAHFRGINTARRTDAAHPPAQAIKQAVEEVGADLVLMGAGGKVGRSEVAVDDVINELREGGLRVETLDHDADGS